MNSIDCIVILPEFRVDDDFQHVSINDPQLCKICNCMTCLTICPSGVFKWSFQNEQQPISVLYKQCIECGACRLVCPQSNIHFQYPHGGYGVMFRDGIDSINNHIDNSAPSSLSTSEELKK